MKHTTIQWHVWAEAPEDGGSFGHGVQYHDIKQVREKDLVAFIEGFQWLRNPSALVTGYHIKPNTVTTARVIAAMKRQIEKLVVEQRLGACGMISLRIRAVGNC